MDNVLTTEDIKNISKKILFSLDRVCRENDISYTVFYGTLLGAVRHSGFIPWDDDVDVLMTRENYMRLRNVIKNKDPFNGIYTLVDVHVNPLFSAPLAKLIDNRTVLTQYRHAEKAKLGVYIDIFVFDRVPESRIKRDILFKKTDFLQKAWIICEYKPNKQTGFSLKYLLKKALNLGAARWVAVAMEESAINSSIKNKDSMIYGNLLFNSTGRNNEIYSERQLLEVRDSKFEEGTVLAIAAYDLTLRRYYHDYMQLPPESQRQSHHNFYAYWK